VKNLTKIVSISCLLITTCRTQTTKEFQEGSITTSDGVQLYYCLVGAGPDTVVVPAAAYLVQEFKRLSPGRTLIFYDPRNRGRSAAASDSTNIGMQYGLADVESVRQYFGLKKMSLIGMSYLGAMVALYAAEHPEQVDRVVQIDPIPPRKDPYWQQFRTIHAARMDSLGFGCLQNMQDMVEDIATPAIYRKMVDRLRLAAMMANPEAISSLKAEHRSDLENESPENIEFVMSKMYESLGDWDWRNEMGNLLMPVLTIQGEQDPIPMNSAVEWVEILPNARLFKIPDSGHLPFVEQPEIFYPAVEKILNGEWPEG